MSPFEDRFTGDVPLNRVTITGFTVEQSCSGIAAPPTKPLWLNIGDFILSGDAAAYALNQGRPPNDLWAGSDDARASYALPAGNTFWRPTHACDRPRSRKL